LFAWALTPCRQRRVKYVAGFGVHSEALEACGKAAGDQAGHFGGNGDGFAKTAGDSSAFGKLPSSSALSGAVDGLEYAATGQLAAAASVLRSVERAIDAVVRSVRNADDAASPARGPS
jgi:hypothetical protein